MSRKRSSVPPPGDPSWDIYGELELKIQEATAEDARRRRETRARFDPGYIYLVQFSTGVTKPGKAVNPESRLAQHARFAEFHDAPIVRTWVSEKHLGISSTERKLLRFCKETGSKLSGEYFRNVTFEVAKAYGEWLVGCAVTEYLQGLARERLAYVERLSAAVNGDMSKTWAEADAALRDAA